ncbi:MAG: hypothetical protein JNK65_05275 [Deltaproteobacteria bacterium]|nr:hypothetical protein [Deltaproteobacteria bacterium]
MTLSTLLKNLQDTLNDAILYDASTPCLIVYDQNTPLSKMLTKTYLQLIPQAQSFDFDQTDSNVYLKAIDQLPPKSLVILIQSSSFRLNEFRFRIELFKKQLKVIEHPHLNRIYENEYETFVNSLAYDKNYYHRVGKKLKSLVDTCQQIKLVGPNSELIYSSSFEDSKLNIGDYLPMKNVGGQFPIGEVFSEPKDLTCVNGSLEIFAFGDTSFCVHTCESPFILHIENGLIVKTENIPNEFEKILDRITEVEQRVWIRELGFGLNRAFTRQNRVSDIGAYERLCGIHLSIGMKHSMYLKEGFPKKKSRFHVDAFPMIDEVWVDDVLVFGKNEYLI